MSVPGRICRNFSAIFAVSWRRGSTTINERLGSFWIPFKTTRARWKPWLMYEFVPMTSNTSECSGSACQSTPSLP